MPHDEQAHPAPRPRVVWGRVEQTEDGEAIEVSGPAALACPSCGDEMGRVSGASAPTFWCSRCRLAVIQPDEETAQAIEAATDDDFPTVGALWADEAEVKARMARVKGGRKTGRRRRSRPPAKRLVVPLVTPDEDERAAEEARRRIAEWESGQKAA